MARLYSVEIEPEVRSWLERLSDRDFGRADFLVGLPAEQAENLGEPYTPPTNNWPPSGGTALATAKATPKRAAPT